LKGWALDSRLFLLNVTSEASDIQQKKSRIQGPPLQSPPQYAFARMKHFTHGPKIFIGELIVITRFQTLIVRVLKFTGDRDGPFHTD